LPGAAREVLARSPRKSVMSNVFYLSSRRLCTAADARADGGVRKILIDRESIRIERVVGGIKMRLSVPVEAYCGVVLSYEEGDKAGPYHVTLAHPDDEFSVMLHQSANWTEVVATWLRWVEFFDRPAILIDEGVAEPAIEAHPRHATLARARLSRAQPHQEARKEARPKPAPISGAVIEFKSREELALQE
jgi:hypothetical protein